MVAENILVVHALQIVEIQRYFFPSGDDFLRHIMGVFGLFEEGHALGLLENCL